MDKFKSLTLFMSVIETGSFAAAAKANATDPSTVSKAIKRLEEETGLQLFIRSTRRVVLTPIGQTYAQTVNTLYRQLADCEDELQRNNAGATGQLKINLPVSYGSVYIIPMLNKFKKAYPNISLDIRFNDEYVDMISHGIDITIRSGSLADSNLIAQKLSPMPFVICGAPLLAATAKKSFSAEDLSNLAWLSFRFKQTGKQMPIAFEHEGEKFNISPRKEVLTVVDSGDAMMKLCEDGLGLCLMPHFSVKESVLSGKVDIVAKVDGFESLGIFVVYPSRDYLPARSKVFIDFLKQYLKEMGETPSRTWLDDVPH